MNSKNSVHYYQIGAAVSTVSAVIPFQQLTVADILLLFITTKIVKLLVLHHVFFI